jgi:hypothetical protein
LRVQPEDVLEVVVRADDRAADDAVQDGLEDRQLDVVVGREADEDQRAAARERAVGLLERLRRDRSRDRPARRLAQR